MFTARKKIAKEAGAEPTELEEQVAQVRRRGRAQAHSREAACCCPRAGGGGRPGAAGQPPPRCVSAGAATAKAGSSRDVVPRRQRMRARAGMWSFPVRGAFGRSSRGGTPARAGTALQAGCSLCCCNVRFGHWSFASHQPAVKRDSQPMQLELPAMQAVSRSSRWLLAGAAPHGDRGQLLWCQHSCRAGCIGSKVQQPL